MQTTYAMCHCTFWPSWELLFVLFSAKPQTIRNLNPQDVYGQVAEAMWGDLIEIKKLAKEILAHEGHEKQPEVQDFSQGLQWLSQESYIFRVLDKKMTCWVKYPFEVGKCWQCCNLMCY